MGFLDGIADIAIRGVVGYASSISEAKEAAETLAIAESQDGWISAEAFLAAYDVRIYDLRNDQYDIKIMKDRDFAGGYVLWNKARDCYHTGIGSDVTKRSSAISKGTATSRSSLIAKVATSLLCRCSGWRTPSTTIFRNWAMLFARNLGNILLVLYAKKANRRIRQRSTVFWGSSVVYSDSASLDCHGHGSVAAHLPI